VPITIFISTHAIETGFYRDTLETEFKESLPKEFRENKNSFKSIPNAQRSKIDLELFKIAENRLQREAMNLDELIQVSKHPLVSIGAHTHTHPVLPQCDETEIIDEISKNLAYLLEKINIETNFLALPYGAYNNASLNSIGKTAIDHVASVENGIITMEGRHNVLPRNGIADASFYENCCRMLDFWYPNTQRFKLKHLKFSK
jgi:peptidoglycan/xylan/chitin deacetylase (PgdA/CDA1 family)